MFRSLARLTTQRAEQWRRRRFSILCATALLVHGSHGARVARAQTAVVDGEIRQLAVSADRVVAIRGDELLVLTTAGQVLGRPRRGRAAILPAAPKRRARADDIVDLYGLPDDDLESDLVRETLEDESIRATGARPRAGRRGTHEADENRSSPRALAASIDAIWISTRGGLLRLPTVGPAPPASSVAVPVGQPGLSLSALAAAPGGGALAALVGSSVLRSGDGGVSWVVLAVLPTRARGIEISADGGEVYVLDDDGVAVIAHRQRIPLFEGRAQHLARCGDDLLILGADGLYAWRWQHGLEKRTGRLPAHRIACSPWLSGAMIAIGSDLLSSFDGGRSWTRRTDLPMLEIESAALGPERLFIGATGGLFVAPLIAPARLATGGAEGMPRAALDRATSDAGFLPFARMRSGIWPGLLPRVSLVLSSASSHPGGTRSAVWLLLTLPLGRVRAPEAADARRAADVLRRRAAAAGDLARLAAAHPEGGEESGAMMRVVQDSFEAFR